MGFQRYAAERAVSQMVDNLPEQLRDRAGHEDPTSLAAGLAGKSPTDLTTEPYVDLVKRYDAEIRPEFEQNALADYDGHVEPKFEKLKYGG
jgi:hypothetical protein